MSTRAHVVLALLTAGALLVIIRLVSRQALKAKYSLLWLTLGLGLSIIAAVPGLLNWTAERLGIFYPPALLLAAGLALLLLLTMHFSYELSRMENRVRTLAEEVTLLRRDLDERSPQS